MTSLPPNSSLHQAAQALLDIAQPLVHLFPDEPTQAFTILVPHTLGAAAAETLIQWDDAVLQTQGVERDRYAHNLPNAEAALSEAERLAVALHLAMDLPAGTFDPHAEGVLPVTLQPFHADGLHAALAGFQNALDLEALPSTDDPEAAVRRGPRPR